MTHRATRHVQLNPIARAAVATTALVASALVAGPAFGEESAELDDAADTAADTTTVVDETSAPESTPTPEPTATADIAPSVDEVDEVDEVDDEPAGDVEEADEVEPSYGFQKFRVGVKSSDGSFQQQGSTAGSTFRVTLSPSSFADFDGEEFDCSTVETDEPSADGTTYCVVEDEPIVPRSFARASEGVVVPETSDLPEDQVITAPPGSRVTVQQLTAADGLEIAAEPVVIEPCTNLIALFPICGTGSPIDDTAMTQQSTALFVNDLVDDSDGGGTTDPDDGDVPGDDVVEDDDVAADDVAVDDALLPDTGAPTGTLFGLGGLLVAAGVTLTQLARQRGRHRG